MEKRLSKNNYFMEIAKTVAQRSTCLRHQVGCILVNNSDQILSTGYNGSPRKTDHCLDVGCIRDIQKLESGKNIEVCCAVHAEQNAIINAAKQGTIIINSVCYCTHKPCITCLKMLINAEIRMIIYQHEYFNPEFDNLSKKVNISTYWLT